MRHLNDIPVKCCRCRHEHMESARRQRKKGRAMSVTTCPRCSCETYFDMRPQVAWCWPSGLIEFGDEVPTDAQDGSGPIKIAEGPLCELRLALGVLARHGRFESAGTLLVPGIPEAENQSRACFALVEWLVKCHKKTHRYPGVQFTPPPSARNFR